MTGMLALRDPSFQEFFRRQIRNKILILKDKYGRTPISIGRPWEAA
jgi:hypothetical protein